MALSLKLIILFLFQKEVKPFQTTCKHFVKDVIEAKGTI